jgi:hypothetical protein
MSIHNITDYKLSKRVVRELPEVLKIVEETLLKLNRYKHYRQAAELIKTAKETRMVISSQIERFNKINQSKGEMK